MGGSWWSIRSSGRWGGWLGGQLEASLYFLWRNMWRVMTGEILCWVKSGFVFGCQESARKFEDFFNL